MRPMWRHRDGRTGSGNQVAPLPCERFRESVGSVFERRRISTPSGEATDGCAEVSTRAGATSRHPNRVATFDPQEAVHQVKVGTAIREFRNEEIVFSQGDPADAVFYLERGRVKRTVVSPSGKEAVLGVLEEGNFFGEGCLSGQSLRMATASSIGASAIVRIAKKRMVDRLRREPGFTELFTAYLLSRSVRIEQDLVDQLFNSSEKRLARLLLLLAHFGEDSKPHIVVPRMSQDTLASMVGTTRSRVSYFMNRFRRMGFIDYDDIGLRVHPTLLSVVLRD